MTTLPFGTRTRKVVRAVVVCAVAAVVILIAAAPASAQPVYTFENLANGPLEGQDGWVQGVNPTAPLSVGAGSGVNLTKVVSGNAGARVRTNNGSFAFAPLTNTDTNAILQFDAQATSRGAWFALGADTAGDADALVSNSNELGPWLGFNELTSGGANPRFYVRDAASGAEVLSAEVPVANAWYRLQLRINFTANGGNGSGSLFRQNLTAGEIAFTPIADLQNLDLNMSALPLDARPANWNTMFARSDGDTPFDNLAPGGGPIPEPSAGVLLMAAGIAGALRRRRRFRSETGSGV